ncbi:MAG: hypothetical protein J0653_06740, partial [Deltaproteobacteria bacterium]|nr:hypothetical protein [Deltaproteobacteria bacterium]
MKYEREALSLQVPALTLLASLHQYMATTQALKEGAENFDELVATKRKSTEAALAKLDSAMADHQALITKVVGNESWLRAWKDDFQQIDASDANGLAELHTRLTVSVRGMLDKLNENSGLLVDGEAASSRLIGVLTSFVPELID